MLCKIIDVFVIWVTLEDLKLETYLGYQNYYQNSNLLKVNIYYVRNGLCSA